jgi:3-deoxy-7-phosphoheptulonate synthase
VKKLPTAAELIQRHPLSELARQRVQDDRDEIRAILDGRDERLLMVVGPCSAWPDEAVLRYAERLKALEPLVSDQLKLVLRAYVQKPRTSRGWTGPINQPDPFGNPDIEAGMDYCRRMMVRIVEMGLPIADEALFTHNSQGFLELLSWVAIGARSSEDPEHRIWASAFDAPVGLKNPTSGCIGVGTNSVLAAQSPHTAVFDGYQVETGGNPYAHLVLRGGVEGPNYHLNDLYLALRCLRDREVRNPAVIIDASHDNSRIDGKKDPIAQEDVVREVLANLRVRQDLRGFVRGFLVESFLKAGNQSIEACTAETVDRDGLSITDPCLSWDRTEALVLDVAQELRTRGTEEQPLRRSA